MKLIYSNLIFILFRNTTPRKKKITFSFTLCSLYQKLIEKPENKEGEWKKLIKVLIECGNCAYYKHSNSLISFFVFFFSYPRNKI